MKRVAILISGGGSNMLALVRDMVGDHPACPVLVASNDPAAWGLAKAAALGIPTAALDHRAFPGREAFEATLRDLATPEGRKTFMDQCIQAQKSVDAADRLIKRAKRPMSDPDPLFGFDADHIQRFIARQPTGPGPLYAECSVRVKGSDLFAESAHEDLYAAVDELVDKLDRQVVRHKNRLQDHHAEARRRLND